MLIIWHIAWLRVWLSCVKAVVGVLVATAFEPSSGSTAAPGRTPRLCCSVLDDVLSCESQVTVTPISSTTLMKYWVPILVHTSSMKAAPLTAKTSEYRLLSFSLPLSRSLFFIYLFFFNISVFVCLLSSGLLDTVEENQTLQTVGAGAEKWYCLLYIFKHISFTFKKE